MLYIFIVIILITLLFNYAIVRKQSEYEQQIKQIQEQQELDEMLNIYTDIPDIFKQYYIENNYGSLDTVTKGLFEDPNIRLVNA